MINTLNSMADNWWTWQIAMLWQTAVLIGIIWIVDVAIRKWAHPQVRYALWMLVLVKLLIPPTWTSPASITSHIPPLAQKAEQIPHLGRVTQGCAHLSKSQSQIRHPGYRGPGNRALTQPQKRRGSGHCEDGCGDQQRDRHIVGGLQPPALRPGDIGETGAQGQ